MFRFERMSMKLTDQEKRYNVNNTEEKEKKVTEKREDNEKHDDIRHENFLR